MTAPRRVTIRPADAGDVGGAALLLRQRDGAAHALADADAYLKGFDPARALAWMAFDGERPVGLSMVYLRTLRSSAGEHRVGYWGNLYVDPDYRRAMVYPRLPLAMFRGAQEHGLSLVVTATRRVESSSVHLQMGCSELGWIPVRVKPLRPLALLARRRRWGPWSAAVAPLGDAAFGMLVRAHAAPDALRGGAREVDWSSPEVEELAALRRSASAGYVAEAQTADTLRDRYRSTLEGDRYRLLVVRRRGRLDGAVCYRMATRGGSRIGVVLDLFWRAGGEGSARRALVAAERLARADGAEAMIHLDGLHGPIRRHLALLGYVRSPETYRILAWPKAPPGAPPELLDPARWWFSFADHDAL